jgi:hypothetical protein
MPVSYRLPVGSVGLSMGVAFLLWAIRSDGPAAAVIRLRAADGVLMGQSLSVVGGRGNTVPV